MQAELILQYNAELLVILATAVEGLDSRISTELSHEFAGKGVLNLLGAVPPKWFVVPEPHDSISPL